jgi:hypothetical protein
MPDSPIDSELAVEVDGDQRIVVTVPASYFRVSFLRKPDAATLSRSPSVVVDSTVDLPRHEFEQLASEVAKAKARELGWIKLTGEPEGIDSPRRKLSGQETSNESTCHDWKKRTDRYWHRQTICAPR